MLAAVELTGLGRRRTPLTGELVEPEGASEPGLRIIHVGLARDSTDAMYVRPTPTSARACEV